MKKIFLENTALNFLRCCKLFRKSTTETDQQKNQNVNTAICFSKKTDIKDKEDPTEEETPQVKNFFNRVCT